MTEESSLLEYLLQDHDRLRRALLVSGQGNVLQIGKYNIHIGQGQDLHIGDRIYQGPDLETMRQVVREVQAEIAADRYAASLQAYFRALRRYCVELPYLTLTDIRPPKNLDEVYVPLRARRREEETLPRKPAKQGKSLTVEQVLRQAQTPHLLILGQPGAGKSTLLRQLAERAYDDPHSIGLERPHLPLLLPLRALARAEGALEARLNQALQNELRLTRALPDGFLEAWPQHLDAPWLFLLDGLDEVPADRHLSLKQWIGDLLARPDIARVILTSRPSAYAEKEWDTARLSVYEIQPFTRDQTAELARRWFGEEAPAFLQALEAVRSSVLTETPLLITIAAKVYLEHKSLPERRSQLYQEFVDIWLEEARERGLRDELDPAVLDLAQPALAHLALAMTDHREWTDEKSLTPVVAEYLNEQLNLKARAAAVAERFLRVMARRSGVFLKRGERYEWVHPTFREYFAARTIMRYCMGNLECLWKHSVSMWREDRRQEIALFTLCGLENPEQLLLRLLKAGGIDEIVFFAKCIAYGAKTSDNVLDWVIKELIEGLKSDVRNGRAVLGLKYLLTQPSVHPRVLDRLISIASQYYYGDARGFALELLIFTGRVDILSKLILDKGLNPFVRFDIVFFLGAYHSYSSLYDYHKERVDLLISLIRDPKLEPGLRAEACKALVNVREVKIFGDLVRDEQIDSECRVWMLYFLAWLAEQTEFVDIQNQATEILSHLLPELENSGYENLRNAAQHAIARIRARMAQTDQQGDER